jgi:hypothetical protein
MDYIIDFILSLSQLIGNLFVKKVLSKGLVEEDSILSAFIGGILIMIILAFLLFIFIKLIGQE